MSSRDVEPLDPELEALLGAERRRPPADAEASARVLSRVAASVGLGGPGDAGGSSSGPAAPPAVPASPAVLGAASSLLKPILLGAALGGVVAIAVVAGPDPLPPRAATAAAASASVEPARPAAPGLAAAPAATTTAPVASAPAPADRPASPAVPASAHEASLAAERVILDEAQRALIEGRGAAALEALGRHAGAFPRGRLGEEREALWIRALARGGRAGEARARAVRFREAYPRSIFLPAVESAVGTIP